MIEPYRRELQVYCYRLLGSLQEAEDAVQETMLRAWRWLHTFEGRSSLRAWLYKIATNVSLDVLDRSARRALPTTVSPPADPTRAPVVAATDPVWMDPFPDDWLDDTTTSVENQYLLRESVSLAFTTALQLLPARQRVVLILCEVLEWRARDVAGLLEITVSAVNSALHRARTTLSKYRRAQPPDASPLNASNQSLLKRYVHAWESTDVAGLVALLKEDATFSMPPSITWFQGRSAIGDFFASRVFADGASFRLQPVRVNGGPGFAAYARYDDNREFQAHAIHVLDLDGGSLRGLTTFLQPRLFSYFGAPPASGPNV